MKDKWEVIENWLAENAPEVKENLNPPATEAEITEVEKTLGVRFPASVRESYLIHNGESEESDGLFGLWRFMPLEEVVMRSKELASGIRTAKSSWFWLWDYRYNDIIQSRPRAGNAPRSRGHGPRERGAS